MDDVINENKPFIMFLAASGLPSNTSESEVCKQDSLSPEMRVDGCHNLIRVKYVWARIIFSSPQVIINSKVFVPKTNVKYLTPLLVLGCYAIEVIGAGLSY
jgi:hypothetical protein